MITPDFTHGLSAGRILQEMCYVLERINGVKWTFFVNEKNEVWLEDAKEHRSERFCPTSQHFRLHVLLFTQTMLQKRIDREKRGATP